MWTRSVPVGEIRRLGDHALLVGGASSERVGEIAFAAGVPVHELVNDQGVLEDIFLELTSEAPA